MTPDAQPLIAALDTALERAPDARRSLTLRRLTDLFLVDAASHTPDQVAVFDDVISHLIENIERRTLIELSNRLAPVDNAPVNVIGTLARHADILIAGPIVAKSNVLTDADLVEIADKDRKDHTLLMMMAARAQLSEAVTDILVKRGNPAVARKVIDNAGARVSEFGFARLVSRIEHDKELAAAIVKRADLPADLRPWLTASLAR